jgi:thiol:disulfide interchange protein DsbC
MEIEATVALRAAEDQMRASFSNLTFSEFEPSPIPGFYQVSSGGQLLYYSPDPELLIFGQVFNSSGVDLTAQELSERQQESLAAVDLSDALVLGDPDGIEIVEFTNPDCPYCRQLDAFLRVKQSEGHRIKRTIIFTTRHGRSAEKALSVLCAEDPDAAFETLFRGGTVQPASCPQGQERLSAHTSVSDQVGVSGTPSLLIAGEFITGFPQAKLEAFLQSAAPPEQRTAAARGVDHD